jgi:hypothetical protein
MPDGYPDLPAGKLANVVTYLERRTPPPVPITPTLSDYVVRVVKRPDLDWYRKLYREIGEPWLWFSRLRLSDDELRAILYDDAVEVSHSPRPAQTKACWSSTAVACPTLSCRSSV